MAERTEHSKRPPLTDISNQILQNPLIYCTLKQHASNKESQHQQFLSPCPELLDSHVKLGQDSHYSTSAHSTTYMDMDTSGSLPSSTIQFSPNIISTTQILDFNSHIRTRHMSTWTQEISSR